MYVKVHPSEEYMSSSAKQFPKTLLRKLAVLLRCKRFLHEPRTDQAAGFKDRLQQACRSSRHKQHFQQRLLLADFLLSSSQHLQLIQSRLARNPQKASAQERESDPTGRAPTSSQCQSKGLGFRVEGTPVESVASVRTCKLRWKPFVPSFLLPWASWIIGPGLRRRFATLGL